MAVLEVSPAQAGQSPEAPGTLQFFEQGQDPATGFQVTSRGAILAGAVGYTGATAGTAVLTAKVTGDAGNRFAIGADGKLTWADGTGAAPDVDLYRSAAGTLKTDNFFDAGSMQSDGDLSVFGANLTLGTGGGRIRLKEGAGNSSMGRATLVGGTVTVNTTLVTANSEIFLTAQTSGAAPGALRVSARTAGTSFTITSTSGTDTSTVAWMIVEPAP